MDRMVVDIGGWMEKKGAELASSLLAAHFGETHIFKGLEECSSSFNCET